MSPPDQERQVDYGDEAVRRPAEKALAYGNKAVGQGVLVAQAPPKKQQKQPSGGVSKQDVDDLIADLQPIFRDEFSRRAKGSKDKITYGPAVGGAVDFEIVPDSKWEAKVLEEAKRLASAARQTFLKFAPELIRKELRKYYETLKEPFPDRIATVDENTELTEEEEAVLFTFGRALLEVKLTADAGKMGGFYSPLAKKAFLRQSQIDAGTVAHEMAHAYADGGWHDFITLMTVRGMSEPDKLDEGMATHVERIAVTLWHAKQPSGTTEPPAGYGSAYTARANKFIKDLGKDLAYEAYFGGWVDFTDNNVPEDTLEIGEKARKKWKWPWR